MNILAFFLGPIGRWVLVAFAVVALLAEVDHRGYSRAASACQSAALQARIDALTKDKAIADEAAATAKTEAERNAREASRNAAVIEDFRRAPNACRLTPDDARRLRAIH